MVDQSNQLLGFGTHLAWSLIRRKHGRIRHIRTSSLYGLNGFGGLPSLFITGGIMLKAGDVVKYHRGNSDLDDLGFVLGRLYVVREGDGIIYVSYLNNDLYLVFNGDLTDNADHFSLVKSESTLPKGVL